MKKFLWGLGLCFYALLANAQDAKFGNLSFEKAVNLSGKQRMLSQKIAKIIVLKSLGANGLNMERELKSSQTLFNRNLMILKNNSVSQSAKVKAKVLAESKEWSRFKLTLPTAANDLETFLNQTESLLRKCHEVVMAIEEASNYNKQISYSAASDQLRVETINVSGKQRMLSQKMCLYYAACRAFNTKKKSNAVCNNYVSVYNEMNRVINDLMVNELNNSEIDLVISEILDIFQEIEDKKSDFVDNKTPLLTVLKSTDNMLNNFNKLTNLYSVQK